MQITIQITESGGASTQALPEAAAAEMTMTAPAASTIPPGTASAINAGPAPSAVATPGVANVPPDGGGAVTPVAQPPDGESAGPAPTIPAP